MTVDFIHTYYNLLHALQICRSSVGECSRRKEEEEVGGKEGGGRRGGGEEGGGEEGRRGGGRREGGRRGGGRRGGGEEKEKKGGRTYSRVLL